MVVFGITKTYMYAVIPFFGFYLGHLLDVSETNRMSMYRDKSCLYKRELAEGEEPSWPTPAW